MFELILIVAAAISVGRMAENDRGEGLKWGLITLGACILSLFIPKLAFLRVLIALGAVWVAMTAAKKTYY